MKKVKSKNKLLCNGLYDSQWDSGLWEEASIRGHIWTHGIGDEAHVIPMRTMVLKLVQQTQDMA
jgi:hypothetical protein